MLQPDSRIAINRAEVSGKVLDGEAIIINVSTGMYYSMDDVGAVVWDLFDHAPRITDVVDLVASTYGIPRDQALEDVTRVAEELVAENLALVTDAAANSEKPWPTEVAVGEDATYASPKLNKYSDMADLLALDPPMPMLVDVPKNHPADGK